MKRKLLVAFCAIIILAITVTGSYAFVTVDDTAKNAVTTGSVDFEILETTQSGETFPVTGVQVLPGDTVSKIVNAKNTGKNSLYLRVKLTKGVDDTKLSAEDCLSMDINETDWTFRDGYYYYNEVLEPDAVTPNLFTKVFVSGPNVGNEYRGATFSLDVSGEAVQSKNNGTNALDATGWPVENDD